MGREINHIELSSKNLMETKRFYSRLFRWKFQMFGDDYMVFTTTKKGVGGGFQLSKKVTPGTTMFYVSVDTIPKTLQKAASLGAKVVRRKKAIGGGMGYWGSFKDPHGNLIGVWSKK